MSRPGTGLEQMAIAGGAPPTALKSRAGTGTRGGTGMRSGSKGAGSNDLKMALTDTLVRKMREKFAAACADVKGMDIVSSEVVSFMATNGSVKEADIASLEARIKARLDGKPQAFAGVKDEWAVITKFEAEQNELEEKKKREMLKLRQKKMKQELDEQMTEQKSRLELEAALEAKYAAEEAADLAKWKAQEMGKMQSKLNAMNKLKEERDAQLQDQTVRRNKALDQKKKEESEARLMLQLEHKRKLAEEANLKDRNKQEMDALIASNEVSKAIQNAALQKEQEEDLRFQLEYAQKLQKQEEDRNKYLLEMKRKQEIAEAAGAARGSYKKWMDEKIIEKNWRAHETMLDAKEEATIQRIHAGNMEMRRVLALQLQEKQAKKKDLSAKEEARVKQFNAGLEAIEAREKRFQNVSKDKALKHKAELEAQMRDNQIRKSKVVMNDVERTMNADLLKKISNA